MPKEPPRRESRPAQRPPRRREYDGVIYEPSSYSERGQTQRRQPVRRAQANRPPASRPAQGRRRTKSKFAVFYILTLLAGVVVCVVLFAMAFSTITKDSPVIEGSVTPSSAPITAGRPETRAFTGLITAIDTGAAPHTLTILDIDASREDIYTVMDNTEIKSRYGSPLTLSELTAGRIVEASCETDNNQLKSLSESAQAWEQKFKTDVIIDAEQSTLTIGNDVYSFNRQTLVLYKGEPYAVGHITPIDTVSVTGYLEKAWCITLETNHGYLHVENAEKVTNGTLAVDTSMFMGLEEAEDLIPLAEGTHRVVVEGSNIETFIADVEVQAGETVSIDLISVEPKSASLVINVNEPDSFINIDGEPVTETGPIVAEYGTHTVRVEKDGFTPVQQDVTITQPLTELNIELIMIPKKSSLILYTSPAQAELFIDNVFAGYSPLTFETETGTHTVTARKSGYNDSSQTVEALEGDNSFYFILREKITDPFGTETAEPDVVIPPDTAGTPGIAPQIPSGANGAAPESAVPGVTASPPPDAAAATP